MLVIIVQLSTNNCGGECGCGDVVCRQVVSTKKLVSQLTDSLCPINREPAWLVLIVLYVEYPIYNVGALLWSIT